MTNKAYHGHEGAYRTLRHSGCRSWDEWRNAAPDFEHFYMRPFVEMALSRTAFSLPTATALEIGCGTGPLCCFLASLGFCVDGVDISETAIAIADEEAAARDLSIRYRIADVCRDSLGDKQYDLIVDGHCLHCIVDESDRRNALSSIRNALAPDGQFWVDTMIAAETTTFGDSQRLDSDGVLWTRAGTTTEFSDQTSIGGEWYLPTRKLHRSPEACASELEQAGLSIQWSHDAPPDKNGEPAGFHAICRKQ
jgi:SAM-dependent methyltransferase